MIGMMRRRMSGKEEELIVTTSLLRNGFRITGETNGVPSYTSISTYCVIEINLSKPIKGSLSVNQGTGRADAHTLFYNDNTFVAKLTATQNPNTITLVTPCNKIRISLHKSYMKTRAFIRFSNGKYVWDGTQEDWARLGL